MGLFNNTPKDSTVSTLKFRYMTPPHERDFSSVTKSKVSKKKKAKISPSRRNQGYHSDTAKDHLDTTPSPLPRKNKSKKKTTKK